MAQKQSPLKNGNPPHKLTLEEQRAAGRRSGEVRRAKKTLAQIGEMIGNLDIKSEKNREILRQAGIMDEDMINDVGMMFRLNMKAQNGDTRAIELLAKLRGQFKEQINTTVNVPKPLIDLTKRKKNGSDT